MIIDALRKKYEFEIMAAKANIDVYLRNSVGIGEHPDIVTAVDTELEKLADAEDKLNTLNNNYSENNDNPQLLNEDQQGELSLTQKRYTLDQDLDGAPV